MIDFLDYLETALVGRYALQGELGRGAQATVYLARDIRHERRVALKVLRPELAALLGARDFLREIKLTARLQHPHILPLYDSGEANGALYYVMPYVSGESLRGRLAREGQIDIAEAVRIAREVGEALDYAHRQGIVHRDIKPENVLLGEDGHALVADFGIARALARATDARSTGTWFALGTPAYMSPEQASGERELDGRSDVYSLGCVLYEMLAGRPPFTGPTVQATIVKRFAGPPASVRVLRSALPPGIDAAITRALAIAPGDRFQTTREFSNALAVTPGSVAAGESEGPPAGAMAMRSHRRLLVLLGIAGLLVVSAVVARVRSRSTATSAAAAPAATTTSAASSRLDPKRVTVATFENQTGNAALDPVGRMAAHWIAHGLVQTGLVDLVDERTAIRGAAGESTVNVATHAADLQSLEDATRAGTVISGSYYLQGDSLRLEARIIDARTGRLVATIESPSVPAGQPTRGVDPLRQRVMGALATMLDPHFREWSRYAAIAPTYPAYREFADGVDSYQRQDLKRAIAHFSRASTLDTSFHIAQLWALQAYNNYVQGGVGLDPGDTTDTAAMRQVRDSILTVLNTAREELGPLDRTLLDFILALDRFDGGEALHYGRQLAALWPDRYAFNVALVALRQNRPREAIALLRRADPAHGFMRGWSSYWTTLTFAEHELGWHRQELVDAKRARQLISDEGYSLYFELRALAALGRTEEAMALASATDTLPSRGLDSWWSMDEWVVLTNELGAHGQRAAARQAAERGIWWAKRRPAPEQKTDDHKRQLCILLYLDERWYEARRVCTALAAKRPDDPEALVTLASLAARRGDREAATRFAVRLEHANLLGWYGVKFAPSPAAAAAQLAQVTRAHIAALTGQREEAVRLLQAEAGRWILWDPLPNQLDWDSDFASLRGYPPFEALKRTDG